MPDLIRLMLDGKLSAVGRLSDRIELPHLLLRTNELFAALPQPPVNGYTLTEACKLLFLDMVTLRVLIDRGFLTVKRMKSRRSRVTNDLITVDSLAEFRAEYCTLRSFATDTGGERPYHAVPLRAGVVPVLGAGKLRRIYRRAEIREAMRRIPE